MRHLVFVYGTLKSNGSNHPLLRGAEFKGPATTVEPYGMERNGSPRVYRDAPRRYAAPIVGELYCVDDDTLARLDRLESHPEWYRRERVPVKADNGTTRHAWLYFMPITHKSCAHDLYKEPVNGAHCWGSRYAAV